MLRLFKKYFIFVALLFVVLFGVPALAADGPYLGLDYGKATGLGESDISGTAGAIINIILGLLGIIAVSLIVYAGFLWMTGGGNEEQITKAKSILMASVIGLGIILSAWSITQFVIRSLAKSTGAGEVPTYQR